MHTKPLASSATAWADFADCKMTAAFMQTMMGAMFPDSLQGVTGDWRIACAFREHLTYCASHSSSPKEHKWLRNTCQEKLWLLQDSSELDCP